MRRTLRQGAYPVREIKGLIFAYLGPLDNVPELPIYDNFEIPGADMVPYTRDYPCNWLQIAENAMDPVHAVFLHAQISGPQFADTWGLMGVRDFHERETGFFYTNARRVDGNIWVRVHEIILPNITLAGAVLSMDGRKEKYFGRNSFTRWVVPVDDTHSKVVAWANFSERTDPPRDGKGRGEPGRRYGRSDEYDYYDDPYFYGGYYYSGYGYYGRGYWGHDNYHHAMHHDSNDFTEADAESLAFEGDEDFENDMGES